MRCLEAPDETTKQQPKPSDFCPDDEFQPTKLASNTKRNWKTVPKIMKGLETLETSK